MSKRSNFERRPMDAYQTIDPKAVNTLLPFIRGVGTFAEPCCGDLHLVNDLESQGFVCVYYSDITRGNDALEAKGFNEPDAIITNPPWSRPILHDMILHFQRIAPTWLLFDADWAHTGQARPFLPQCSHIVSVGRLKWIEGTTQTGKDNCAWYRFDANYSGRPQFCWPELAVAA